jgi:transcriptional regulator with XRE-family HTH domain
MGPDQVTEEGFPMAQAESEVPGMSLGAKVHMLRWTRRWTLKDLASKTGIPESTLSRYERGRTKPGQDELVALAVALETTPNDLLDFATGLLLNAA